MLGEGREGSESIFLLLFGVNRLTLLPHSVGRRFKVSLLIELHQK